MYYISIILPVYNVGDEINNAFNSILNQSIGFDNLEVIFVDDCSTDNSAEIIKSLSDSYKNVKSIFLSENSGYAGKPRNVGIQNASADYIMFLDPDDEFFANACEILYNNIHNSDLDLVSGNYIKYFNNEKIPIKWKEWYGINLIDNEIQVNSIDEEMNLFLCPPTIMAKIFKKELILKNNIKFPIGIPGEDLVFINNYFIKSQGIKFIDVPIFKYIVNNLKRDNKSVTTVRSKKLLFGYMKAYYMSYDLLKYNHDFIKYSINHLEFWSRQFVLSNISIQDKIDLLKFAHPLFKIYVDEKIRIPRKKFESFFNKVYKKDFIGAINLCDELSFDLIEFDGKITEINKNKELIFVFKGKNKNILELANLFFSDNYSVTLLNLDDLDTFFNLKDEIIRLYKLDKSINIINIFIYYLQKNSLNKVNLKCYQQQEGYSTEDGFDYLIIDDKITLYDRFNDTLTYFDNLNEFYDYFIGEICLERNKPFLICEDSNYIENIDSSIYYGVGLNNFNQIDVISKSSKEVILNYFEEIFKDLHHEDFKNKLDYKNMLNKLNNENKILLNKNKDLHNKLNDSNDNIINLNTKLNNLNDIVIDLNNNLEDSNNNILHLNDKIDELSQKNKNLIDKNKKLNRNLEEFKSRKIVRIVDRIRLFFKL